MKPMRYTSDKGVRDILHEGTYLGYDFAIISLGRHPVAYVNVPDDHPYYIKDYYDMDISVHGGLSYASGKVKGIEKSGWWIGWDYNHGDDYTAYTIGVYPRKKWATEEILEHVKDVIEQLIERS